MKLLLIISLFATNLIKNTNGQGPKLYKSFDEIFGKGWDDESNCRNVKEEDQDGQAPNTSDQKNLEAEILKQKFDEIYGENWSEEENNSAPSADDLDQDNSKEAKHLSDQNNSTDQDQNESNKSENIKSDQQKREIIQKFREMKEDYKKKRKYSRKEWAQIERKISNGLGVGCSTIYRWIKELGLKKETKSKFSELEKREILKQFDQIKCKCKKAKLKNLKNELDEKIAKKLGVCRRTIIRWKGEFGLPGSTFSVATKIKILKKYAKIKGKNPKMTDAVIATILNISSKSLSNWKKQFDEEIEKL